jgi:uncharacterized protein with PIN domain
MYVTIDTSALIAVIGNEESKQDIIDLTEGGKLVMLFQQCLKGKVIVSNLQYRLYNLTVKYRSNLLMFRLRIH